MGPQSATLTLDMGEGEQQTVQATGNGPVDAIFNAITELVPHKAKLALYQVHAVTEGTDAQAEVSVRLEDEAEGGRAVTGRAADPDTLVASAKAYLSRAQQAAGEAAEDRARAAAGALAAGELMASLQLACGDATDSRSIGVDGRNARKSALAARLGLKEAARR